jgi:hypothetical protein
VRLVPLLAFAALAVAGCSSDKPIVPDDEAVPTPDKLEISVSIGGSEAPTKLWTLECDPPGGTLPRPAEACARLDHVEQPFAPAPKDKACTQIFGGPEVADVTGTYKGKPVNAHFAKGNGCEIARWDSVEFLFPTS